MKVLVFIICAIVFVEGSVNQTLEEYEKAYKEMINSTIDKITSLTNDINKLILDANYRKNIINSPVKTYLSLKRNPSVIMMTKKLKKTDRNKINGSECYKSLMTELRKYSDSFVYPSADVLKLEALVSTLPHISQELEEIKGALTLNLNNEVELCIKNPSECRITGRYAAEMTRTEDQIELLKYRSAGLLERLESYPKSAVISAIIETEIYPRLVSCFEQ